VIARAFRLHREGDVRRVRARGTAVAHGPLVARVLPNDLDPAQNRYTVVAGKRCGKAVQRNRIKRLVREALRGYHPWLAPGHDIVIICRGTVDDLPALASAQQALGRIFTHAGLWTVPPGTPDGPPQPGEPVTTGWGAVACESPS
jgi:ribonuclease P protein component